MEVKVKKIEVLETSLVVPSEETPKHGVWLSNLDLLVARAHTPTVYFYRSNGEPDFFLVEALKASLAKTLVQFYPLAGRLGLDPSGRLQIDCTGEGVLFVVARSDSTVDDFGDFAPSNEMRQLLVPSVESGHSPSMLVMFQETFLKCGGVCLGAAVHHTAADGLGALHFINSWSDAARGADLSVPPSLDRTLLRARSPPSVVIDHVEYFPKPPLTFTSTPPFDSAILKLSKNQLNLLKGGKGLSTFKAVVAHVWRSACKARALAGDVETRLYMTADARGRLRPTLPEGYLGNAIFRASVEATVGEILSGAMQSAAERVHGGTARLDDGYVRSLIDFLEGQEDVRGLAKGRWVMPESDLWVISWQGLPIYEADFGWGKPVFMGRACLQFSGLVYIMNSPPEVGGGGLTLAVGLERESLGRFKEVFYAELVNGGGEGGN